MPATGQNTTPISRLIDVSKYYESLDQNIRAGMIAIASETIEAVVEHILFVEETGKQLRWRERSRLSVRFRLQGPLGGTYSDAWSQVIMVPIGESTGENKKKMRRSTQHIKTGTGKKKSYGRIRALCRPWERDATMELVNFLHCSRQEYMTLSRTRTVILATARLAGGDFVPEPIADPKLGECVAATRELRKVSSGSLSSSWQQDKFSSPSGEEFKQEPGEGWGVHDNSVYRPLENYSTPPKRPADPS